MKKIAKPAPADVPSFYKSYIDCVPGDENLIKNLVDILIETEQLILSLPEEKLLHRYSAGKWSIKDIINHLSDCERIITYRALRIARADETNLPGFDEDHFAKHTNADKRTARDLLYELRACRMSSIALIETMDNESLNRKGSANGYFISARLLINHLYGHHRHHLNILKERYLK
ncbi:MAG: DinB family protein [Bacteroidetes bacterium]|nr:DinB family protein [Bacteroidota bacterium]